MYTDNSLKILESLKKNDHRIEIINQKNQGVSIARNNGIKKATADYIVLVDADDFLDTTMIEKLYKKITSTKSDIAFCDYFLYQKRAQVGNNLRREYLRYPSFSWANFRNENYPIIINMSTVVPWGKIMHKKLLLENNIFFPEGLLFEDNYVGIMSFLNAKKMTVVNEPLYYYRIDNPNSLSGKSGKYRDTLDLIKISTMLIEATTKKFSKNTFINRILLNWIISNNLSWFLLSKRKKEYYDAFHQFLYATTEDKRFSSFKSDPRIIRLLSCRSAASLYCIACFRRIQRYYRSKKRAILVFLKQISIKK